MEQVKIAKEVGTYELSNALNNFSRKIRFTPRDREHAGCPVQVDTETAVDPLTSLKAVTECGWIEIQASKQPIRMIPSWTQPSGF